MSKDFLIRYTEELKPMYKRLGDNLERNLKIILTDRKIDFLSVGHRIKAEESINKKIVRKNYLNPSEEIEDFCGIRIICYYQEDIKKINDLLTQELDIISKEDKELQENELGYRSHHLIIKLKKDWLNAPDCRGLENIKAEIQIRTILMHAWAEISHKLAYKREHQIPKEYRRLFNLIGGNLETADFLFEELKKNILAHKETIQIKFSTPPKLESIFKLEMDLDTLQPILDHLFDYRSRDLNDTAELILELNKFKITIEEFLVAYDRVKDDLLKIEEDILQNVDIPHWSQVGAVRIIMEISNVHFRNFRNRQSPYRDKIEKWSNIIYSMQ